MGEDMVVPRPDAALTPRANAPDGGHRPAIASTDAVLSHPTTCGTAR